MAQRAGISLLILFVISILFTGCGGGGETNKDKAKWGSAKFGTDKWNQ